MESNSQSTSSTPESIGPPLSAPPPSKEATKEKPKANGKAQATAAQPFAAMPAEAVAPKDLKASREATRLNELRASAVSLKEHDLEVQHAKDQLKKARADRESVVQQQQRLCLKNDLPLAAEQFKIVDLPVAAEKDKGQLKLFPGAAGGTAKDAIKQGLDQAAADKLQSEFNACSLGQIGVKGKLKEKLEADGIKTGEQLQKWHAEHPRRKIPGLGEGAVDRIAEAMAEWFEKKMHPPVHPKLTDGRNSLVASGDVGGAAAAEANRPVLTPEAVGSSIEQIGDAYAIAALNGKANKDGTITIPEPVEIDAPGQLAPFYTNVGEGLEHGQGVVLLLPLYDAEEWASRLPRNGGKQPSGGARTGAKVVWQYAGVGRSTLHHVGPPEDALFVRVHEPDAGDDSRLVEKKSPTTLRKRGRKAKER